MTDFNGPDNEVDNNDTLDKEGEIVLKSLGGNRISIGPVDYRALISLSLIGVTAYLALTANDAWREFALMTGMTITYWFKRGEQR